MRIHRFLVRRANEAGKRFDAEMAKFNTIIGAARGTLEALQGVAAPDLVAAGHEGNFVIQTGHLDVAFNNTNYLSMEQLFPLEFPTVPEVFVGEARGGAWLIVKVDFRDTKKFVWAANNILGASNYATTIQWLAIAKKA